MTDRHGRLAESAFADRLRHLPGLGLRTRIMLAFTLGSLTISLFIALATIGFTRHSLVQERELRTSERVRRNASFVAAQLAGRQSTDDPSALIGSVVTPAIPMLWLRDPADPNSATKARFYTRSTSLTVDDVPSSLRNRVMWSYSPGIMRAQVGGRTQVVAGVPVTSPDGAYFEIESMDDIGETIRTLSIVLVVTGSLTTLFGTLLGWWASGRALRPLALIGDAARKIADGRLETRLDAADYAEDPELGPLVSSFNEMVSALQRRIDQDARFASDVSHELRSPLMTLNASVAVLRNAEDDLPDRARQALGLLDSDITRFSQLVEDLLEISRFDAGAVRLEKEPVAIVDRVRKFVGRSKAADAEVRVAPQLEGLVVDCDGRRILRILANFIENADKYAGGVVAVTMDKEGENLIIGVEDAGPGIPPDETERIFARFSRGVHGGARGADTGSGLGLALASEHARLHGGRVAVENRPGGQGSRFTVSLPVLHTTGDDPAPGAETTVKEWNTGEHKAIEIRDGASRGM